MSGNEGAGVVVVVIVVSLDRISAHVELAHLEPLILDGPPPVERILLVRVSHKGLVSDFRRIPACVSKSSRFWAAKIHVHDGLIRWPSPSCSSHSRFATLRSLSLRMRIRSHGTGRLGSAARGPRSATQAYHTFSIGTTA